MWLEEQVDEYLKRCENERRLDAKTVRAYRVDLTQYCGWLKETGGSVEPFSRETVRMYLAHLNGFYAPASVKRKMASLRAFISFMRGEGLIGASPFDGLKLKVREPKRLPRTISVSDMEKLFRYVAGAGEERPKGSGMQIARDRAILEMLIATGVRVSELCAMDVADIDLPGKAVRIAGKGSKERIVQLEDVRTLGAIAEYLKLRESREGYDSGDPFFLNRAGARLSDRAVREMISRRCEEAGVEAHITPHMFRHTFATWLLESDVDIRYIQRLLGHSSLRTTEIYTHVTSAKLREILRDSNPRKMIGA